MTEDQEDYRTQNSQKLGSFVARTMEELEHDYPDAELGDILIVCELKRHKENITTTRYVCTDGREHIHIGMLRMALKAIDSQ